MFKFFKKNSAEARPAPPEAAHLHLDEIPGAIKLIDGFPRVDWSLVSQSLEPHSKHPSIGQMWTQLAAQWLGTICQRLGDDYQVYESEHMLVMSSQAPIEVKGLLKLSDGAYELLANMLGQNTLDRGRGKCAVLVLKKRPEYYDYISYFVPDSDREYGTSGGVHVSRGYRHIALNGASDQMHRTLVHELAHDIVFQRPLPRWLNEGLAQFAEDLVPGYRPPIIDHRQVRLQHRYWTWFGTNHFWSGKAFDLKSSQRVSYKLAEILFRNLVSDRRHRRSLAKFLATAHREDAGAAACKQCFGCSLSDLVEEFLGPGNWECSANK